MTTMSTLCHNSTSEQNFGKTSIQVARLPHSVKVSGVKASGGWRGLIINILRSVVCPEGKGWLLF